MFVRHILKTGEALVSSFSAQRLNEISLYIYTYSCIIEKQAALSFGLGRALKACEHFRRPPGEKLALNCMQPNMVRLISP